MSETSPAYEPPTMTAELTEALEASTAGLRRAALEIIGLRRRVEDLRRAVTFAAAPIEVAITAEVMPRLVALREALADDDETVASVARCAGELPGGADDVATSPQ